MRFAVVFFGLFALIPLALQDQPRAARNLELTPIGVSSSRLELIVFESPRCNYCPLIRRDVLPRYQRSSRAKEVPMRFVDLNDEGVSDLKLTKPLRIMPTMVLMKDGREVSRIGGYIGPELFFHAISRMIARAAD